MNKKILGVLLVLIPASLALLLLSGFMVAVFGLIVSADLMTESAITVVSQFMMVIFSLVAVVTLLAFIIFLPIGIWLFFRGDKKWPEKFSIKEVLFLGWQKMLANFWFFVGIIFVAFLFRNLPSLVNSLLNVDWNSPNYGSWIFWLAFAVMIPIFAIQLFIQIGLMQISLKLVDGKSSKTMEMFANWDYKLWLRFLLSSLIYVGIVLFGLILLVVPGIIWAIKYQFFGYFVIEGDSPIEAIKKSGELTKGAKLDVLTLNLVSGLLNLLGTLVLLVGLFVSVPVTMVAQATTFRRLQDDKKWD